MAKPNQYLASDRGVVNPLSVVVPFAVASALLAIATWAVGSHDFHRLLDRIPWFELMHGVTALGDGGFALVIALWLGLRGSSKQEWLVFLVGFVAASLIPQFGKTFIWPDAVRPYGEVEGIHLSPLFEPAYFKSFPSGHSSVGAFFAFYLTFRKPSWRWWYVALGISVGLSRLALHYHWTEDVIAGWIVGLCSAWLAERTLGPKLDIHGTT